MRPGRNPESSARTDQGLRPSPPAKLGDEAHDANSFIDNARSERADAFDLAKPREQALHQFLFVAS